MPLINSLADFDPDANSSLATAFQVDLIDNEAESSLHSHRKGQLVLALQGGVTCEVPNAHWMVPTGYAVWIPGGMTHKNRTAGNAQIYFLFVEPDYPGLLNKSCTLNISPMLREMIRNLATRPMHYEPGSPTERLVLVMLDELVQSPVEYLYLPVTDHIKMKILVDILTQNPGDRSTLKIWASRLAMSSSSFERFIRRETGLTFGRWRQQFSLITAVRMLVAGMPVQNIAFELGYDSTTAFITMFKKALGKTPGRYLVD